MAKLISQELKKYYKKEKNRLIFSNGMTLNQLALEMWERLGFKEVDASVISRVINGERTFTPTQLKAFCLILNLNQATEKRLEELTLEELAEKLGFPFNLYPDSENSLIDSAHHDLEKIFEVECLGNFDLAYEWVSNLHLQLKNHLEDQMKNHKVEVMEILQETVFREASILNQGASITRLCRDYPPLVKELVVLANQSKSQKYLSLADLLWGYYYYSSEKDYQLSLHYTEKALKAGISYPDHRLLATRTLALDFAYLKDRVPFRRIEKQLEEMLKDQQYSLSEDCQTLEGIGRGQAALGEKKFDKTIERAWNVYRTLNKPTDRASLRKVQLARTEIESFSKNGMASKMYLESIGLEAIKTAQEHGFHRHEEKIWQLLSKIN